MKNEELRMKNKRDLRFEISDFRFSSPRTDTDTASRTRKRTENDFCDFPHRPKGVSVTFRGEEISNLKSQISNLRHSSFVIRHSSFPPRLCWWTPFPTPNETVLVRALREAGADVAVCYFKPFDGYRRMIGWRERPLGAGEFFAPTLRAARRRIPDFDARVPCVPSYADAISWRLMIDCLLRRRPWFASIERSRNGWRGRLPRRLFASLADRFARCVLCVGREAVEQMAVLGVRREKLAWTTYAMPEPAARKTARTGAVRFAFVGALTHRKAVDILAEAFAAVRAACPDATLRVVGDGETRGVLASVAGVELVGAVPPERIDALLADCDVIVLPSRYDPWGVALVEGARMSLAMIASDGVGAAELISDDPPCGVVVRAGDAADLARAMRRYAENPALARAHGANAARAVRVTAAPAAAARVLSALFPPPDQTLSQTYTLTRP